MAHLDVYKNRDPETEASLPYVLDVQSDLLAGLPTVIVVPLARPESIEEMPILRLNPKVDIDGQALVVLTQDLAAIPRRLLKSPVANLSPQRDNVLAALDLLFTGL